MVSNNLIDGTEETIHLHLLNDVIGFNHWKSVYTRMNDGLDKPKTKPTDDHDKEYRKQYISLVNCLIEYLYILIIQHIEVQLNPPFLLAVRHGEEAAAGTPATAETVEVTKTAAEEANKTAVYWREQAAVGQNWKALELVEDGVDETKETEAAAETESQAAAAVKAAAAAAVKAAEAVAEVAEAKATEEENKIVPGGIDFTEFVSNEGVNDIIKILSSCAEKAQDVAIGNYIYKLDIGILDLFLLRQLRHYKGSKFMSPRPVELNGGAIQLGVAAALHFFPRELVNTKLLPEMATDAKGTNIKKTAYAYLEKINQWNTKKGEGDLKVPPESTELGIPEDAFKDLFTTYNGRLGDGQAEDELHLITTNQRKLIQKIQQESGVTKAPGIHKEVMNQSKIGRYTLGTSVETRTYEFQKSIEDLVSTRQENWRRNRQQAERVALPLPPRPSDIAKKICEHVVLHKNERIKPQAYCIILGTHCGASGEKGADLEHTIENAISMLQYNSMAWMYALAYCNSDINRIVLNSDDTIFEWYEKTYIDDWETDWDFIKHISIRTTIGRFFFSFKLL